MIINSPDKGDILIYVDSVKQKAINPNDLLVVVGRVVTVENKDGTTYKKVGVGTPKKLSVVLSEQEDKIDSLSRELNAEKIKNRKILNKLTKTNEVLLNQSVLFDIQINELKTTLKVIEEKLKSIEEEKNNEK